MINHYQVGGSLSVDAPTYINRQADRELLTYLEQGDFCYVFNSRQMGKSSLLIRTKRFFYRVKYISLDNLNYACNWVKNYSSFITLGKIYDFASLQAFQLLARMA